MDFSTLTTILSGIFILTLLIDPFWLFLLAAGIYEYKLRKRLPNNRLKGIDRFEYALSHDDDDIRQLAKRGVIAQLIYCVLWLALIVGIIFLGKQDNDWAVLILPLVIAGVFVWFAYRYWQLLRKARWNS